MARSSLPRTCSVDKKIKAWRILKLTVSLFNKINDYLLARVVPVLLVEGLLQSGLARAIAEWLFTLIVRYSHLHRLPVCTSWRSSPSPFIRPAGRARGRRNLLSRESSWIARTALWMDARLSTNRISNSDHSMNKQPGTSPSHLSWCEAINFKLSR